MLARSMLSGAPEPTTPGTGQAGRRGLNGFAAASEPNTKPGRAPMRPGLRDQPPPGSRGLPRRGVAPGFAQEPEAWRGNRGSGGCGAGTGATPQVVWGLLNVRRASMIFKKGVHENKSFPSGSPPSKRVSYGVFEDRYSIWMKEFRIFLHLQKGSLQKLAPGLTGFAALV